ncbi:glycosyltransferase family protein [Occultella gossypii]|uniref:Glycosyltransferase n=1 Tax=Occultella gossypii TaxID=2800820 RepID=A0ABS7S7W0_9MICO|nr:glycosyltransferase [Occultella gossypii]MBZ2196444.1 glycosyltransferase [Occultella gossypii]
MHQFDLSIITSAHDVADARLHRQVAALRRAGVSVEILGLGAMTDGPQGAQVRVWPRRHGLRRAWFAMSLPWRSRGRVVMALDPDSSFASWLAARLTRRRVVSDVHEDYRAVLSDRVWARGIRRVPAAVWARLGIFAASHSDAVIVADVHLLPELNNRVLLRNLPDLAMLPEPAVPQAPPRALYIGDVRASRGLFTMLDAIAAAPGWRLELIGPMADSDRSRYEDRLASDPDLASRVQWHDRLPPQEAWTAAAGASVGLSLLDDTPAFRAAMPSKVFEYLATGLPVLTSALPRPAELVRSIGAGAVVTGAAEAAEVLGRWAGEPDDLARTRERVLAWRTSELVGAKPTADFVSTVTSLVNDTSGTDSSGDNE